MIIKAIKRRLHAYGHGVHSPMAFALCMDILRQRRGYAWYGYDTIQASLQRSPEYKVTPLPDIRKNAYGRRARFLLRLASHLHPQSVWISDKVHPCFHTALKCAVPNARILSRPEQMKQCSLIIDMLGDINADTRRSLLLTPGRMMLSYNLPTEQIQSLIEEIPSGLILHDRHSLFTALRTDMLKTSYLIPIP